jgi:hypothetical protein
VGRCPGARAYLPEEIAYAVMCIAAGQSLTAVANELDRDRSGLLRTLKSLGYPTAPQRLTPAQRRAETLARIDFLRPLSREEIKDRILRLRRAPPRPPPSGSPPPPPERWTQPHLPSSSESPAD